MQQMSDIEIREKGLNLLFKKLGEATAIRFLSQIAYERRDYMSIQNELFRGMNVDEIYEKAKEYQKKK